MRRNLNLVLLGALLVTHLGCEAARLRAQQRQIANERRAALAYRGDAVKGRQMIDAANGDLFAAVRAAMRDGDSWQADTLWHVTPQMRDLHAAEPQLPQRLLDAADAASAPASPGTPHYGGHGYLVAVGTLGEGAAEVVPQLVRYAFDGDQTHRGRQSAASAEQALRVMGRPAVEAVAARARTGAP